MQLHRACRPSRMQGLARLRRLALLAGRLLRFLPHTHSAFSAMLQPPAAGPTLGVVRSSAYTTLSAAMSSRTCIHECCADQHTACSMASSQHHSCGASE